jgi:adenosylhomocysteine nucleosidase
VIALYEPAIVYSAGFAGALDPSLKVGEVLRPGRIVNAGDGSSEILGGADGVLVTFGSVASPAQKKSLRESFGARAVDMESAAVARAAEARGIAFEAVKVISDASDFKLPSMEQFVDPKGRFSEWRFAFFVAVRPWMWGRVIRLARNSSRASRALCAALRKLNTDQIEGSRQVRPSAAI